MTGVALHIVQAVFPHHTANRYRQAFQKNIQVRRQIVTGMTYMPEKTLHGRILTVRIIAIRNRGGVGLQQLNGVPVIPLPIMLNHRNPGIRCKLCQQ